MSPEYQKPQPIIIENPSALTRRNAIGSPDAPVYGANVSGGPETQSLDSEQEAQTMQAVAESAGGTIVGSNVEVDPAPLEQGSGNPYDKLFDTTDNTEPDVESAAVRDQNKSNVPGQTSHRPGYWKRTTPEKIAEAKKYGFDLSQQAKYFK